MFEGEDNLQGLLSRRSPDAKPKAERSNRARGHHPRRGLHRRDIEVHLVVDIEAEKWTRFVVGGTFDGRRYREFLWPDEEKLARFLLTQHGKKVWAHFGGGYDYKWLLDWAIRLGIPCTIIAAGSRVVVMKSGSERREACFYDSHALTKISLRELTSDLGVQKQELKLPCIGKDAGCDAYEGECEGYCAISREMNSFELKRLRQYLEADCRSLWEALQRLRVYAADNDIDLGPTIGSSAWRNAKRLLQLEKADANQAFHDFARQAYYGGRVQLFRPAAERAFEYDVNSMYPSCLAHFPVPVGRPELISQGALSYLGEKPGMFTARVTIPECHVPPLPFRIDGRLAYPTGTFTGVWTAPELRAAEGSGVKILEMGEALVYPEEKVLFAPWVERIFKLRAEAPGGKKSPIGTFLKFYLNSLTGKFGSNPWQETYAINPNMDCLSPLECSCRDSRTCDGCCGVWRSHRGSESIWVKRSYEIPDCGHVEWSAYLTSWARVRWGAQARSVEDGLDLVYGDTDSIFSLAPRTLDVVADSTLGKWHAEGPFEGWRGIAPKTYLKGTDTVKAKGGTLPKNPVLARKIVDSGAAPKRARVLGFKAGLALAATGATFFSTRPMGRAFNEGFGDRIFLPEKGYTRAPTIEEVVERFG